MKTTLRKYTDKLATLKEKRAGVLDKNTEDDNERYDQLIKQVEEFIEDLKQLNKPHIDDAFCSCKIRTGSWVCGNCGKPLLDVVNR